MAQVYLSGHTIAQVNYGGRLNMFDADCHEIQLLRDNFTVGGGPEIAHDHDLLKRTHEQYIKTPDNRDLDEQFAAMFIYEGTPPNWTPSADTYTMNMTLHPHEAITWRWGHLDPLKYYWSQPNYQDCCTNGLWEYTPDFTNDAQWRSDGTFVTATNIVNTAGTLYRGFRPDGNDYLEVQYPIFDCRRKPHRDRQQSRDGQSLLTAAARTPRWAELAPASTAFFSPGAANTQSKHLSY